MGTRKVEAMALKWKDVNFKTGIVNIHKTVSEKSKEGGWRITSPKNPQSIRKILMPQVLINQMKIYYDYCKQYDGFSRPLASTTIARNFDKYVEEAEIDRIKIHDLRHSHASLLINNGASILIVSLRLDHKDVNETLNTYSHMFPTKEKEIINIIDNLSA